SIPHPDLHAFPTRRSSDLELKPLTRELHHRTDVFLCVCDWYRVAVDQYPGLFERPGEHADEVETSMGLAFFPHLVKPELADAGRSEEHTSELQSLAYLVCR